MQYTPQGDMSPYRTLYPFGWRHEIFAAYHPVEGVPVQSGSYVDWRGNIMNPTLSLKATERMRASVADGDGDVRAW